MPLWTVKAPIVSLTAPLNEEGNKVVRGVLGDLLCGIWPSGQSAATQKLRRE